MGNRPAERTIGRTVRVNVDPLVILRRVSEEIDARLFDPVTLAEASTAIGSTSTQAARAFSAAFGRSRP